MYYSQNKHDDFTLHSWSHTAKMDDSTYRLHWSDWAGDSSVSFITADTYSYRSRRPHDAVAHPVYGEALINQSSGITSYLASYKQAVLSLNDELQSQATPSGSSGRGAYDSGHLFWTKHTPAISGNYAWVSPITHYANGFHYWQNIGGGGFALTGGYPLSLENPAMSAITDKSTVNAIQRLASATVPDRITGSLGQDIVDLAQLPRFLASLVKMSSELPKLYEQWHRLPSHVRDAIDHAVRHPNKASKAALRRAGSGYLEWLFVLQPYVEDLRLITNFLSKGSARLLTRETFTGNRFISERPIDSTNGDYVCSDNRVGVHFTGSVRRSVHVAIGWMAKGISASDDTFLSKARALNRSLGVWYPSLLWDLAPWTWLIDWCLHLGDTIDNVSAIQRSGYNPIYSWATVREEADLQFELYPYTGWYKLLNAPKGQLPRTYVLARYPFDVDGLVLPSFSGLSSAQKVILGALGLSHLK